MRLYRSIVPFVPVLLLLGGCTLGAYPTPPNSIYLLFFEEFSADLMPEARAIIDFAAVEAKRRHTTVIRVEARASAAGSTDATMRLAKTRAAVVRDALQADGIAPLAIWLVPLGQMATTEFSVVPRRVTIILEN